MSRNALSHVHWRLKKTAEMFLLWHVTGGTTIDILVHDLFRTGTCSQ